jgi:hypothetical protein
MKKTTQRMNTNDFKQQWATHFGQTPLVSFCFRTELASRWMRIHSLPKSKRYPTNDAEWEILLMRQNSMITDVCGNAADEETRIHLLVENYYDDVSSFSIEMLAPDLLKTLHFQALEPIDLEAMRPDVFADGQFVQPTVAEILWKPHRFNDLLLHAAMEGLSCSFVSFERASICAPYEGGMDCIFSTIEARDAAKSRYAAWLSAHPSGE